MADEPRKLTVRCPDCGSDLVIDASTGVSAFVDGHDVRPLRQIVSELAELIKSRALRRLRGMGILRAPDRKKYLNQRRKFKGVV